MHSAIYDLRTKSRSLWVDALCINQNDDEEREYQVSLVGKIYFSAKMVCVWLGLRVEACIQAFHILDSKGLCRKIEEIGTSKWTHVVDLFGC
jgi:hypothetical protein